MPDLYNPYIAGPPLHEDRNFFGRDTILQKVKSELRNPGINAVVLFGQRRVGKTSLLRKLERTLDRDSFLPVYFDLQDQASRPLGMMLAELADTIALEADLDLPEADQIDDQGVFFQRQFLPEVYGALGEDRRLILLLDEFDVLEQAAEVKLPDNVAAKSFFPFLRRLLNENVQVTFVFVVGRQADDLTTDFSTFKGSTNLEVWILKNHEDAEALVRQAELNQSLQFTDESVSRVLGLTNRHPYFTQLLCQRIWERAYRDGIPPDSPLITEEEVEAAVPDALEAGESAITWLWNGLTLPEKIYATAFAQADEDADSTISEDHVIQVITEYAARLRTSEVEQASKFLIDRRVLQATDREGKYRFAVEIFRRWVHRRQRLQDIKDELDKVNENANNLYQTGRGFFDNRQWGDAIRYYREALTYYPDHFRARLELGEALLALGQREEAITHLEKAYELDKTETRYTLARSLIQHAKVLDESGDESGALEAVERALTVSPNEREAHQIEETIWLRRAEAARKRGEAAQRRNELALAQRELESALNAYEKAGAEEKVSALHAPLQIVTWQHEAEQAQSSGEWDKVVEIYDRLINTYSHDEQKGEWEQKLETAKGEAGLSNYFRRGLQHLQKQNWLDAQREFSQISAKDPAYIGEGGQTASRLLMLAQLEQAAAEHYQVNRWQEGIDTYQNLLNLFRQTQAERSQVWEERLAECREGAELAQLFDQGCRNLNDARLEDALAQFQKLLSRNEGYKRNGRLAANLLRETEEKIRIRSEIEADGQWEAARIAYEQLLANAHNEEERMAWQAEITRCTREEEISQLFAAGKEYLNQEEWSKAQRALAEVVNHRPDYQRKGDVASTLLDQAVSQQRFDLDQRFQEGVVALDSQEWPQAERAFADVVFRQPDFQQNGQVAAQLLEKASRRGMVTETPARKGLSPILLLLAGLVVGITAVYLIVFAMGQTGYESAALAAFRINTPESEKIEVEVTREVPVTQTLVIPEGTPMPPITAVPGNPVIIIEKTVITNFVESPVVVLRATKEVEAVDISEDPILGNLSNVQTVNVPLQVDSGVQAVAYSPDGDLMVITSAKEIIIFQLQNGSVQWVELSTLAAESEITSLAITQHPVNELVLVLAAGLSNGKIFLLEIDQTSEEIKFVEQDLILAHTDRINQLTFSPSGLILASGSDDNTIASWCVLDGRPIDKRPEENEDSLGTFTSLAFKPASSEMGRPESEEGTILVTTSGEQGLIRSWGFNLEKSNDNNNCIPTSNINGDPINSSVEWLHGTLVTDVRFSPDGQYLATAAVDGEIKLWQFSTNTELPEVSPLVGNDTESVSVNSLSFLPGISNKILAAGDQNGDLNIWDIQGEGNLLQTIKMYEPVKALQFAPNGRILALGLAGQGLKLLHSNLVSGIGSTSQAVSIALTSLDDSRSNLAAIGYNNGQIQLQVLGDSPLPTFADGNNYIDKTDTLQNLDFLDNSGCGLTLVAYGEKAINFWQFDQGKNQFTLWPKVEINQNDHYDVICHDEQLYLIKGETLSQMALYKISAQSAGESGDFDFDSSVPSDRLEAVSLASVNDHLLLFAGFEQYSPRYWIFNPQSAGTVSDSVQLANVDNADQKKFIQVIAADDGSFVSMLTTGGAVQIWKLKPGAGDDSEAIIFESIDDTFSIAGLNPEEKLPFITYVDDNSLLLGFGFSNEMHFWEPQNPEFDPILTENQIKAMTISPSGSLILTLSENGNIEGWAVRSDG